MCLDNIQKVKLFLLMRKASPAELSKISIFHNNRQLGCLLPPSIAHSHTSRVCRFFSQGTGSAFLFLMPKFIQELLLPCLPNANQTDLFFFRGGLLPVSVLDNGQSRNTTPISNRVTLTVFPTQPPASWNRLQTQKTQLDPSLHFSANLPTLRLQSHAYFFGS